MNKSDASERRPYLKVLRLRLHYLLRSSVIVFLFGCVVGLRLFLRGLFVFGLR